MKRPANKPPTIGGSIRGDEVYPLREFCRRLGIGRKSWISMRNGGLRFCTSGRQIFIVGNDALKFFGELVEKQATRGDGEQ